MLHREEGCRDAVRGARLVLDVLKVVSRRVWRDAEPPGDLVAGQSSWGQAEHLDFTGREAGWRRSLRAWCWRGLAQRMVQGCDHLRIERLPPECLQRGRQRQFGVSGAVVVRVSRRSATAMMRAPRLMFVPVSHR